MIFVFQTDCEFALMVRIPKTVSQIGLAGEPCYNDKNNNNNNGDHGDDDLGDDDEENDGMSMMTRMMIMMMMMALVLLMMELRSSTMLMSMMCDAGTHRSHDEARNTRPLYKQTPDRPPLAAATMLPQTVQLISLRRARTSATFDVGPRAVAGLCTGAAGWHSPIPQSVKSPNLRPQRGQVLRKRN